MKCKYEEFYVNFEKQTIINGGFLLFDLLRVTHFHKT